MEVGEELWWKVELSLECVLCDCAMEVVLDSVLGCVSAAQEAAITGPVSSLVSSACAPAVP